ncbi:hypothetical protein ACFFGH_32595 [Lysobacter korlensis]|uniref:DUF2158 domain-containing protein n=1 Tax=Lysobacter korlensis TaxID=553636 RepID=A0ABV6S042_9GAMM
MFQLKRGDIVVIGDRVAVVVALEGEDDVPEEHVALWFGPEEASKTEDRLRPIVWTAPAEYCSLAAPAEWRH